MSKNIKISDDLYRNLREFCDKKDIPLVEYVEGVLETSMYYPDGIELAAESKSYERAEKKPKRITGKMAARFIKRILGDLINNEDWICIYLADLLGPVKIAVGKKNTYVYEAKVLPEALKWELPKFFKKIRIEAIGIQRIREDKERLEAVDEN